MCNCVHLRGEFLAEFAHRHQLGPNRLGAAAIADLLLGLFRVPAHRADGLAQEIRHAHAGDRGGVLKGQEQARLGALVGLQNRGCSARPTGYRREMTS